MRMRFAGLLFAVCAAALCLTGCSKSDSQSGKPDQKQAETKPAQTQPAPQPIARLHWLGINRIIEDTNGAAFKTIWELPETVRLKNQTLDKLALAPWRQSLPEYQEAVQKSLAPGTNRQPSLSLTNFQQFVQKSPQASRLRALLDDILQQESYFELRPGTHGPGEFALAVRLDDNRALLWQTNAASLLNDLTGTAPTLSSNGFSLQITNPAPSTAAALFAQKSTTSLTRVGAWVIFATEQAGAGPSLLTDFARRIQSHPGGTPFEQSATNYWIELKADLAKFAQFTTALRNFGIQELPVVSLAMIGDGQNVRTRGSLKFSKTAALDLKPWTFPTNLVHDPLMSFSAVRGLQPVLTRVFSGINFTSSIPEQLYGWAQQGPAIETFAAVPVKNSPDAVTNLASCVNASANPWLNSRHLGKLVDATNYTGLSWEGLPFFSPFVQAISGTDQDFLFAGYGPSVVTNFPAPGELLNQFINNSNLCWYEWEVTGQRVQAWIYLGQLMRLIAGRQQLPPDSASLEWMKNVAPKFANCVSELTQVGPGEFAFIRKSSGGLNSLEIHLLCDWLQSPDFPNGLFTTQTPKVQLPSVTVGGGSGAAKKPK